MKKDSWSDRGEKAEETVMTFTLKQKQANFGILMNMIWLLQAISKIISKVQSDFKNLSTNTEVNRHDPSLNLTFYGHLVRWHQ